MFGYCESLTSLKFNKYSMQCVVHTVGMLWNCKNLEALDLSEVYTSSIREDRMMFGGCEKLEELDLSKFRLGVGEYMTMQASNMFKNCINLKKVVIGYVLNNFNSNTKKELFYGCDSLTDDGIKILNKVSWDRIRKLDVW